MNITIKEISQFRIGNRIHVLNHKEDQIEDEMTVSKMVDICTGSDKTTFAIPLTHDWLRRFGFVGNQPDISHSKLFVHPKAGCIQLMNLSTIKGGFKIMGGRVDKGQFLACTGHLEFVHQLQNFFVLSGGEPKLYSHIELRELMNEQKSKIIT